MLYSEALIPTNLLTNICLYKLSIGKLRIYDVNNKVSLAIWVIIISCLLMLLKLVGWVPFLEYY